MKHAITKLLSLFRSQQQAFRANSRPSKWGGESWFRLDVLSELWNELIASEPDLVDKPFPRMGAPIVQNIGEERR